MKTTFSRNLWRNTTVTTKRGIEQTASRARAHSLVQSPS
jgi:hypothetical protein